MPVNPVLAHLMRNNWLENRHRAAFCVLDSAGRVVLSAGDVNRPIFPRSALKSVQSLALFKSGAVDRFNLDSLDIAIASASHLGEPEHIHAVGNLLEKTGCRETDFECGSHPPTERTARKALTASGVAPSQIHNNCSGKHAGMLAVARALEVPVKGYSRPDHPVQKLVREGIEEIMGMKLDPAKSGTDGCSLPAWSLPLQTLATGFVRASTGTGLSEKTARATKAIVASATSHPFLIAGTGAFDTDAMAVFGNALMSKGGAEGVFCGSLPELGLGYALKCDDGNMQAAQVMIARLLLDIANPNDEQRSFLMSRSQKTLTSWRGLGVASIEATGFSRLSRETSGHG